MYEGVVENGKIQNVYFYDPNRESKGEESRNSDMLMMYSEGRLTQQFTKEEMSRNLEVNALYRATYDFTLGKYSKLDSSTPKEYKEVYESTYERLRNNAVA
jgi:hypothetical protein